MKVTKKSFIQKNEQHSKKIFLSFSPLISLASGGKLIVHDEGIKVVQDQVGGKTFLVGLQSHSPNIIHQIYNSDPSYSKVHAFHSGIWVTNFTRNDQDHQNQFLYLHIFSKSSQEAVKLHLLSSIICSTILVQDQPDKISTQYLLSLEGRILANSNVPSSAHQKEEIKKDIANLMLVVQLGRNNFQSAQGQIIDKLGELNILGILDLYFVGMYHVDVQQGIYIKDLEKEVMKTCAQKLENSKTWIEEGPVLAQYIEIVVQKINKKGIVDVQKSKQQIEISQDYDTYLRAVGKYNSNLTKIYKDQYSQNQLDEMLGNMKDETVEQYHKKSNNAFYLDELNGQIGKRQKKIRQENTKVQDLKNVNFLQKEAEKVITKVQRQKLNEQNAKRQIDIMVQKYDQQAQGQKKHQILSQSLNVLYPSVLKIIKQRQLKEASKENGKLRDQNRQKQRQIKELQDQIERSKKKGCCAGDSCCQIM